MRIGFFPFYFKIIGGLFLLVGLVMAYMVIVQNYKPEFLDIPVFAIYSFYLEKTVLGMTYTNLTDEIALVFPLLGLIFLIFSKQYREYSNTEELRTKALIISVMLNSAMLVFLNLTTFGTGFVGILILSLYSQLVIYLIIFNILYLKSIRINQ